MQVIIIIILSYHKSMIKLLNVLLTFELPIYTNFVVSLFHKGCILYKYELYSSYQQYVSSIFKCFLFISGRSSKVFYYSLTTETGSRILLIHTYSNVLSCCGFCICVHLLVTLSIKHFIKVSNQIIHTPFNISNWPGILQPL